MYIYLFIFILVLHKILNIFHRKTYKRFYQLPSPTEVPHIGQSIKFLTQDTYKVLKGISVQNGFPCRFTLNNEEYYFTTNIDDIKNILTRPESFDKSFIFESFSVIFPNSLILAPVHLWKEKRKYLSKCFNSAILNGFVSIFHQKTTVLMDTLTNREQKTLVAFQKIVSHTFHETMLGSTAPDNIDMVHAVNRMQEIVMTKIFNPFYHNNLIFSRSSNGKELAKYISDIKQTIDERFFNANNNEPEVESKKGHKETYQEEFKEHEEDNFHQNVSKKLLIDVIKELHETGILTKQDVWSEIMLFIGAATDTSANALAFTFCFLGMYPEIQDKVYKEIITQVGTTKDIEYTDIPNLKYTEQVFLESMRIFPPAPYISRRAAKDMDFGGVIVPKGCNLLLSIIDKHRDENIYPDPLKFDPDRFLPEEIQKRDPYTYLAFSGGPRNCIGMRYAKVQMKVIIANIIRKYKISSTNKSIEELDLELGITLTAKNMDCKFEPRN